MLPVDPISKDITKDMLAEVRLARYYPGEFVGIKHDDLEETSPNCSLVVFYLHAVE